MRIAIKDLKVLSKKRGLNHIIVWATDEDGHTTHVATYGKTVEQCDEAARWGDKLKDVMGWPKSLRADPSRVKALKRRIKELETELADLRATEPYMSIERAYEDGYHDGLSSRDD